MNCPACHKQILPEDINIQADIGKCAYCHAVFKISENISGHDDLFKMENPVPGTWFRPDFNGIVIGASTRSPIAFFLVPFMLVWSGGALGGIYGSQIMDGKFDLFTSLFGIPFILGSVIFWSLTLMAIMGKVEIQINHEGGKIFTGIAKLGFSKSFQWVEVNSVSEKQTNFKAPGNRGNALVLEGKRRVAFGFGLNESRRYYLLKSLQNMLANKNMNRPIF